MAGAGPGRAHPLGDAARRRHAARHGAGRAAAVRGGSRRPRAERAHPAVPGLHPAPRAVPRALQRGQPGTHRAEGRHAGRRLPRHRLGRERRGPGARGPPPGHPHRLHGPGRCRRGLALRARGWRRAGFRRPRVEVVREAGRVVRPAAPLHPDAGSRTRRRDVPPAPPRRGKRKGLLATMQARRGGDPRRGRRSPGSWTAPRSRPSRRISPTSRWRSTTSATTPASARGSRRSRSSPATRLSTSGASSVRSARRPSSIWSGSSASLPLASLNPYAEPAMGWVVTQGDLEYKVRFLLDGDTLDTTNELVLGQLRVAPARGTDEVRARLGLPLNLIVALAKDRRGEIHANVPVAGSIRDPQFDLRETVWTAVRQSVGDLVRAPFRAIGRAVRGGDTIEEPTVDPVTFAAGSSVIAPDMEKHLLRVADVLRRSPFVNLALAPALAPADVEALQARALAARVRAFQDERGWPDGPGILVAYFTARFPGEEPPETVEAQLALLRAREPAPDALLVELARRHVDVTRERLVSVEGIPAERLRSDRRRPTRHHCRRTPPGAWSSRSSPATNEPRARESAAGGLGRVRARPRALPRRRHDLLRDRVAGPAVPAAAGGARPAPALLPRRRRGRAPGAARPRGQLRPRAAGDDHPTPRTPCSGNRSSRPPSAWPASCSPAPSCSATCG